jgi:hypothetical protein
VADLKQRVSASTRYDKAKQFIRTEHACFNQNITPFSYDHGCKLVGEVEFRIILAKVQNSFCIIVFRDNIFCQRLLPEALELPFLETIKTSFRICGLPINSIAVVDILISVINSFKITFQYCVTSIESYIPLELLLMEKCYPICSYSGIINSWRAHWCLRVSLHTPDRMHCQRG